MAEVRRRTDEAAEGILNEDQAKPFTGADIRFTRKGEALYAIFMEWPDSESAIGSLGERSLPDAVIEGVELVGGPSLRFRRDSDALRASLPPPPRGAFTPVIRILGRGLV